MPKQDNRTIAGTKKGKHSTAGRRNVVYRDAKGQSKTAAVLDAGSSSGIKIAVGSNNRTVVDNVPTCTTLKSTGCYISRIP